ncbi:uncharacterized protein LOC129600613 [Paramacrobiotus metropolitanus]|uniref:uncharacterized protein LOC129600613 n=1 Tax=Paramacrobiotus metropolitanus TaxID=2943436 RepID=UPI002445EE77|nr:uncharacterized protein LOC129600613 [Paramacrobiotus metropolitanus]XP_055355124.1 uncharacterized protein LOC129600613 [Paramacrobiotus metropolitanus]
MHLYGGKRFQVHPVHQWNSVDVLTESGLFQHGEVVEVAENGLIVDFRCSEQRSQFVSYDKIFDAGVAPRSEPYHNWLEELQWNRALTTNACVQVLWRSHPGAAWLWYPARLLHRGFFFPFDSIGLVFAIVKLDGRLQTELFSAEQVRFRPSKEELAKRALKEGCFAVREQRLPADFLSTTTSQASDHFRQYLQLFEHVQVIAVLSGTLKYVQRKDATPLTKEDVAEKCEESRNAFAQLQRREHQEKEVPGLRSLNAIEFPQKRKLLDDDAQSEVEWVLPTATHLLREIFHSLDSVSREKLRRVCPLWNDLLSDADSAKTVRISFSMNPFFPQEEENFTYVYGAVAGLLKFINGSTQRLIIECVNAENLDGALAVIKWVLRDKHLKQLILHDVEFISDDLFAAEYVYSGDVDDAEVEGRGNTLVRRLAKDLTNLAPCCEEVRLRRCEINCRQQMTVIVPHATIKLDAADIEAQFWNLYEANLPCDGVNVQETAEWIRTGSAELRTMIVKYLKEWQSDDPRLTTQYRDHEWTVENLNELDVSKLTALTLRALKEVLPEEMEDAET